MESIMRRPAPGASARGAALGAALALLAAGPAHAAPGRTCDVTGARIEEGIAAKAELRADANAQTLRDLRTLRDAAIVLDTYKYPGECEVLLGVARTLLADSDRTIARGGDTDEEKAEGLAEAREPKASGKASGEGQAPAKARAD